jgi:hypothetical protein
MFQLVFHRVKFMHALHFVGVNHSPCIIEQPGLLNKQDLVNNHVEAIWEGAHVSTTSPTPQIQSPPLSISTAPHYGHMRGDYHLSYVCRKLSWSYVLFPWAMISLKRCSNKANYGSNRVLMVVDLVFSRIL